MDLYVGNIDVQEYHEFTPAFSRAGFEPNRLAAFLNTKRETDPKWRVERKTTDSDQGGERERVIIENVQLAPDSWLFVEKMIIDSDSVLWTAIGKGRKLTAEDEQKKAWPEWALCTTWLQEFYELNGEYFEAPRHRFRDVYITRTEAVRIACKLEELLRPELFSALRDSISEGYRERKLGVVLHPFGILTKINATPTPEAMQSLTPGQIKAAIARDDLEIGVRRFEDYEEMALTIASQMPYHSHVKTLRAIANVAVDLSHRDG